MPKVEDTCLRERAAALTRQYRAAVARVAAAAGAVVGKVTVEATDVRRVERAVDMRAAYERFAELLDLIEVHVRDDHGDHAR